MAGDAVGPVETSMGILKHLLFWPVTGPLFLVRFSLDRVQGVVREELTDDTRVKAELLELQLALELGDIDEAEFVAREAELMRQLREIREWREQFGMDVPGGLVRVRPGGETEEPAASSGVVTEADAQAAAAAERAPEPADPHSAVVELNVDRE